MKKLAFILVAIMLIGLLPVTACQRDETETHTPVPVKDMGILQARQESADDIMPVPGGGPAYRANIHQQAVENPWPSIEVSEAYLGSGADEAHVSYRSYIETAAGETRNNIIKAIIPGKDVNSLSLYADNVPTGIALTDGMQWSGPSARASVLVIEIAPDLVQGEYPLEIGLEINGKDYGTMVCTVSVIEETGQPLESFRLDHARPYLVVSEGNLANEDLSRSVGLWFITSEKASSFEEYAQTAIQATIDLYSLYRNTFTEVLLIPQQSVQTTYAQAFYAADGKGAWGMTGSVPATPKYWHARAMDDLPYNAQELAILELWQDKQDDFPSRDLLSSLSYDETALRQYIADTLQITYSETQVRQLNMIEYKVSDKSLGQEALLRMPPSEAALQALESPFEFTAAEKAMLTDLISTLPTVITQQFDNLYETAEEVSRDSKWMIFSSWRPYTQSGEYRQLLEFCQREGQAVWPLLFQQLDSENPHFAGGLVLDVTLPEYLYYFEKTGRQNATQMEVKDDILPGEPDLFAYIRELLALLQDTVS